MKPIPFKLWMAEKCQELGVKYQCLFMRINRGQFPKPPSLKAGRRTNFVLVDDDVAERVFPEGIPAPKPRFVPAPKAAREKPCRYQKKRMIGGVKHYCDCGTVAERKWNGAFACERCIDWETKRLTADTRRPSWAKYVDRFSIAV